METQMQNFATKTKSFLKECSRVLKITKKPSKQEFWMVVKVTGIGILAIGLLGFLIQVVQIIAKNWFF